MHCEAIFGPPGTGKTATLERLIADYVKHESSLAVLSFTRAASHVLTGRVDRTKIPFIGTIHSMAYNTIGAAREQVATADRFYQWFGDSLDEEEMAYAMSITQYMQRTGSDLDTAIAKHNMSRVAIPSYLVEHVVESYANWKEGNHLIDFDDMLVQAKGKTPKFKIVVVDEGQDLSPIQWDLVVSMVDDGGTLVVAGDDDQAIFTWAGADPHAMAQLADSKTILGQSWRIPKAVHQIAENTISKVVNRVPKTYLPRDKGGLVHWCSEYLPSMMRGVQHTILCRDAWTISEIEADLVQYGIPYKSERSIFDSPRADAIRAMLNGDIKTLQRLYKYINRDFRDQIFRGIIPQEPWQVVVDIENLTYESVSYLESVDLFSPVDITISTIHNYKGKEDDHIVLVAQCPYTVDASSDMCLDDEIRVWYVGITRAKETLTIVGENPYI